MGKIVKIMKKIKIKNLIVLIILLAFNTFAWFVYNTRVAMDLSIHVSSWEIQFVDDDNQLSRYMYVAVERAYPGMDDFEKIITVRNDGEIAAQLSYELESITILGQTYSVTDTESNLTSDDLEEMLDDYPFTISIGVDDENLNDNGGGEGSFTVSVSWPYESGDDELDTEWGNRAYEYYAVHPNGNCILLQLKLIAQQRA